MSKNKEGWGGLTRIGWPILRGIAPFMVALIFLGTAGPVGAAFFSKNTAICEIPSEVPALMDKMVPDGRTVYRGDTNTNLAFSIYENDRGNWVAIVVQPNGLFCFIAGNPLDREEKGA